MKPKRESARDLAGSTRAANWNHSQSNTISNACKSKHDPFATVGGPELSAWSVAPGVVWVQSRRPEFTDVLRKRRDARLVVRGVLGGYLRTFEVARPLRWARAFVDRQLRKLDAANSRFSPAVWPQDAPKSPGEGKTAALLQRSTAGSAP